MPPFFAYAEPLQPREPTSSLHTYIPSTHPGTNLSSLTPHCDGCRVLVPDKPKTRAGGKSFHRPSRNQGSKRTRLKNGHVKFKPAELRAKQPPRLPNRSLIRLGLQARHFESWQLQAVDGDTAVKEFAKATVARAAHVLPSVALPK